MAEYFVAWNEGRMLKLEVVQGYVGAWPIRHQLANVTLGAMGSIHDNTSPVPFVFNMYVLQKHNRGREHVTLLSNSCNGNILRGAWLGTVTNAFPALVIQPIP